MGYLIFKWGNGMQNFNVQIKDELVPVFLKMIAGFRQDIVVKNDTMTPNSGYFVGVGSF